MPGFDHARNVKGLRRVIHNLLSTTTNCESDAVLLANLSARKGELFIFFSIHPKGFSVKLFKLLSGCYLRWPGFIYLFRKQASV